LIEEIKGLDTLTNLQSLSLSGNQIKEIEGLGKLTNLRTLYLDRNQIEELKGLEHLENLQKLHLFGNPILERDVVELLTYKDAEFDAQELVRYCQEKESAAKIIEADPT